MAGQGRPLALSDRYPDATRLAETRKSFETSAEPVRFGTEGSEVQILSPRPIFLRKLTEFSRLDHSVSPEWFSSSNCALREFP